MKKLIAALVLLPMTATAYAYDMEVNISGKIVGSTCSFTGNKSMDVLMPDTPTASLKNAGSTSNTVEMYLQLQNCPAVTKVKWEHTQNVDSETGALKNTADGPKDLYVQVLTGSGDTIDLTKDEGQFLSTTQDVTYQLRYYTPTGITEGGDFATQGYLTIIY
ncbi:fimbrial protein [Pseudomonas sp. PDM19]|uniref:fimbrial protein n=1 Tax=Pseudomonas sp. PDM19 TaxID=2769272 RepID=UPI001780C2A4|nr:fimbrial protein [Pseudomonas sp. PDM19]MBD9632961.1 type 1 fimbrial protein [Pseudomonas sp. PDM19]